MWWVGLGVVGVWVWWVGGVGGWEETYRKKTRRWASVMLARRARSAQTPAAESSSSSSSFSFFSLSFFFFLLLLSAAPPFPPSCVIHSPMAAVLSRSINSGALVVNGKRALRSASTRYVRRRREGVAVLFCLFLFVCLGNRRWVGWVRWMIGQTLSLGNQPKAH